MRSLGRSSVSDVVLVRDAEGRARALKILRPQVAGDPRILARWRREARLLEEIEHPNLVRSHGTLELGDRLGLLLEYIEGPNLRQRLDQGPLGWEEVARIGIQVARALESLHRHGTVHRDVKPHNILMHPRRGAVLADLGLVRSREDPSLTRQGAALGSPAYMSPEQARDPSATGPEGDVYSLGATLHHALSGEPPFLGRGIGEVIHRVLHEDPEPLPEDLPEGLREVLAAAMDKDPDRRYARAQDFRSDLVRVLTGQAPRTWTRARRRQLRIWVGVPAALLLLVGAIWYRTTPPATPTVPLAVSVPIRESIAKDERPLPEPPVPLVDLAFWFSEQEKEFLVFFGADQLRRAAETLQALPQLPNLASATEPEKAQHRTWLLGLQRRLAQRGEDVAILAEGILNTHRAEFLSRLESEQFQDPSSFRDEVERAWVDRQLPVLDLPLFPGSADPRRQLASVVQALQVTVDRRLAQRAQRAFPAKRKQVHEALLAGRLQDARLAWAAVDRELLAWSPEALREELRMQALAGFGVEELYRTPLARLEPRLGKDPSSRAWLSAHLAWCRGDLLGALQRMRPLMAEKLAGERDPEFWVAEWERELQQVVPQAAVAREPATNPPPLDFVSLLMADWQRAHPEALVERRGQGIEVTWVRPDFGRAWRRSLNWDRRQWTLQSWGLLWELAEGNVPPRLLRIMGEVELRRESPHAVPVLRVQGRTREGFGIQAGVPQDLVWEEGRLWLDGLDVGVLDPPQGTRLVLEAEAIPGFVAEKFWIRVVPQ